MLTMSVTPNITIVSNDEKLTYRWNEKLNVKNTEVFSCSGKQMFGKVRAMGNTSILP